MLSANGVPLGQAACAARANLNGWVQPLHQKVPPALGWGGRRAIPLYLRGSTPLATTRTGRPGFYRQCPSGAPHASGKRRGRPNPVHPWSAPISSARHVGDTAYQGPKDRVSQRLKKLKKTTIVEQKKRKQHLFVVKVCKNNKLLLIHVVFLIVCCFSSEKCCFLQQFVEKTKNNKKLCFWYEAT